MEIGIGLIGGALAGLLIGLFVGYQYLVPQLNAARIEKAKSEAEKIKSEAEREAEKQARQKLEEAEEEIRQERERLEEKFDQREEDLRERERALNKRDEKLTERYEKLERKEQSLSDRRENVKQLEKEAKELRDKLSWELEETAQLSRDEAREKLMDEVREEAEYEAAQLRKEILEETEDEAKQEARKLIVEAMWRTDVDHYNDAMVSTVELPSDKMKGRVIGKNGRNIHTLEKLTGCEIIVDDTPELVTISSFDPVRRELCRVCLERLVADGRIHPGRIEDVYESASDELEEVIWEAGQEALFATNISGVHDELVELLGQLKFRTSYGQNVLKHSIEVAFLCSTIAAELGVDPTNAKRGGLLHDIGKAVDKEREGSHQFIGMELAEKYGENEVVCNCIGAHHGDIEQTLEAAIVQVADSISASRPGARGESLENFVDRLESLEEIGGSFAGVDRCFAIEAGREVRVMVEPEEVDDVLAHNLSRKVAQQIEEEVDYPGVVKVNVIRESREIEYAR